MAVDGSEHGEAALRWAASSAMPQGARLTLFSVSEDLADKPAMFALRTDAARILQLALDDHARTVVEDAVVPAVPHLDITRRWTRGAPGPAILDEIASQPYDLVVLGALGYSASRRRFGSVTRQVLLASEVPVMVVPAQPAELVA